MAYITVAELKLALRAPATGSWASSDDTYDDLLTQLINEACSYVDSKCEGWAPFDAPQSADDLRVTAGEEVRFGILGTPPFRVEPTKIEYEGTELTDITLTPQIAPIRGGSGGNGKNLLLGGSNADTLVPGRTYTLKEGVWWWFSVPDNIKLATTRIASQMFWQLNNSKTGMVEDKAGNLVYAPRVDRIAERLLARYFVPALV